MRRDFISALEERTGYDFIANNYCSFRREELKDIILELLYEVNTARERECMPCIENVVEELCDRWHVDVSQEFGVGDIAFCGHGTRVKILEVYEDGDEYVYKVEGVDLDPPTRLTTDTIIQKDLRKEK